MIKMDVNFVMGKFSKFLQFKYAVKIINISMKIVKNVNIVKDTLTIRALYAVL